LSEARKIAAMAEATQLPVAPHDCTGPVVLMPRIEHGYAYPPAGPGLGTELVPGLEQRPDATARVSRV